MTVKQPASKKTSELIDALGGPVLFKQTVPTVFRLGRICKSIDRNDVLLITPEWQRRDVIWQVKKMLQTHSANVAVECPAIERFSLNGRYLRQDIFIKFVQD
jgi:hypothetical protein